MPPMPSVFGEIEPHTPGAQFDSRKGVRNAGLHRHEQAGISGSYEDGADAIVVSGGYVDDIDEGDVIVYTGQGGRDPRTGLGKRFNVLASSQKIPKDINA